MGNDSDPFNVMNDVTSDRNVSPVESALEGLNLEKQFSQEQNHWWFKARNNLLKQALRTYASNRSLNILEIGAATGGNALTCGRFGKYTALDFSDTALEICRSRSIDNLVKGNAQCLPFASQSFDVVVALDILEHLHNDRSCIVEIERVLRPEGLLIINVPAFQKLFSAHDISFDHIRRYEPGELAQKLEEAYLHVLFISYWSFFIFPAVYAVRIFSRIKRHENGASDFDRPWIAVLGGIFGMLAAVERSLMRRGLSLPFGVSQFCVAKKLKN